MLDQLLKNVIFALAKFPENYLFLQRHSYKYSVSKDLEGNNNMSLYQQKIIDDQIADDQVLRCLLGLEQKGENPGKRTL